MKKFRLTAMLLAPCKEGYEDNETKKDYYALREAIRCGDDEFAKAVFAKYELLPPCESDNYEDFDTDLDYALDADRDGVYMYRRCPARAIFEQMSLEECISYWNDRLDKYRISEIHDMDDDEWWDRLAQRVGTYYLIRGSKERGFNFDDRYFFYCDSNDRLYSFTTKEGMLTIIGEEWFINELTNER